MIKIQRAISDCILESIKLAPEKEKVNRANFVSSDRTIIEDTLVDSLNIDEVGILFFISEEEQLPKNKGLYHQVSIVNFVEVTSIIRGNDWSCFGLIYPKSGLDVWVNLGPDYEGDYELSLIEYGSKEMIERFASRWA